MRVPVLALDSLRAGPRTILRAARSLLADDVRDDLKGVRAPTLLVWGERDALVPPALGPVIRAQLADARLLVLPGAGHVPQYDRPRQFDEATLAFLAERTGVAASAPEPRAPGQRIDPALDPVDAGSEPSSR